MSINKTFSADIENILNIVTNRLYSDKSVFLRELISNSVDAIQKLKNLNKSAYEDDSPSILIKINKEKKLLLICDNGIGMSRLEIERNLSIIGYSGTNLEKSGKSQGLKQNNINNDLIGEFGLGFYSCFPVGEQIRVWSRKYGEENGHIWISDCKKEYKITSFSQQIDLCFDFGTQIEIKIKKEYEEYLDPDTIKQLIKKYMNYVPVKIFIDDFSEQINCGEVVWNKNNITDSDHKEIFENILKSTGEIYIQKQKKLESSVGSDYNCFFYIGSRDYFLESDLEKRPNVVVYVNNVFVCEDSSLLPGFLGFVKCFINITNGSLSVSRDSLQESGFLTQLSLSLPVMILKEIIEKQETDRENYIKKLWTLYCKKLKIGATTDTQYRSLICNSFLFYSTQKQGLISLQEYLNNDSKKDSSGKKRIAYSFFEKSPQLNSFLEQNKDVLVFNSEEDTVWPLFAINYGDYELFCIDLFEEDLNNSQEEKEFLEKFSKYLEQKVEKVVFSKNLYCENGFISSFLSNSVNNNYKFRNFVDLKTLPILGLNKKHIFFQKNCLQKISLITKTQNIKNQEYSEIEQYLFDCIYSICTINDEKIKEKQLIINTLEQSIKRLFSFYWVKI